MIKSILSIIIVSVFVGCEPKVEDLGEYTSPAASLPNSGESTEEVNSVSPEEQIELQVFEMEVIRPGMPPLPIPLSPELDKQLVKEGILPPLEE